MFEWSQGSSHRSTARRSSSRRSAQSGGRRTGSGDGRRETSGNLLEKAGVGSVERVQRPTVDIDLPDDGAVAPNRDDDLGLRIDKASEILSFLGNVAHDCGSIL